jgi:glutathione S-transferase
MHVKREVTAYRWVPDFAWGFVRDLRIRWALEEAGLPYEIVLMDFETVKSPEHRRWQPFGQVPAYRDDEVEMFESGAIVLHLAEESEALAPADKAGRARVTTWVVAALNSIEPHAQIYLSLHAGPDDERRTQARARLDQRLAALGDWLGDEDYLEGRFTAADIVMTCALRELVESGVLRAHPSLDAYRARCEARPAFARSLEAQLQTFRENAP